jgi:tetratricopeptide (TPR) repeat protein
MTSSRFAVAHLDEIDELDDGRCAWRPVRQHLGIESFGVNTWTGAEAGSRIINEHDESDDGQEELYLVLDGQARFELDGEQVDAPAGTFVLVPPGLRRTAFAQEAGTTIIAIGGIPGQAYEVTGWESWAPLNALYRAGQYEEAADRGRELVEASPPHPALLYNVACCESLAGRHQDAIEHLREAIERSEQLRSLARDDSDLDPLHDDPAFKDLVDAPGEAPGG